MSTTTTPPAHAAPPVIRADPALRRKALLIVLAAALVWTIVIARGLPRLEAWAGAAVVAGNTAARLWLCFGAGVLIATFALLVSWSGANIIRMARRAAAAGQFPPPGIRVLRDTRVIEGRAALLLSRTYVVLGTLLLTCAAALLGLGGYLVVMLWP